MGSSIHLFIIMKGIKIFTPLFGVLRSAEGVPVYSTFVIIVLSLGFEEENRNSKIKTSITYTYILENLGLYIYLIYPFP